MNEILTPCILQTIIICISSILALYCIASLIKSLAKKKNNCETCPLENKNNCETCHEKKHLSYKLIVGFLVFLLVILFTHKFYADDNIFNFMSFASAIISIILAVLTIIYTYYTQGTTTSSAEKIEKTSSEMKTIAGSIKETAQSNDRSAEILRENINKIIDVIKNVESKTDDIINNLANLQKNPSSNNKLSEVIVEKISSDVKEEPFDINTYVDNYIKISSPLGNIAMYACIRAYDCDRKVFNMKDIFDDKMIAYCGGFLIATTSAGFVQLNIDFDTDNISVRGYANIAKHYITEWFDSFNIGSIPGFIELKSKIDSYFDCNLNQDSNQHK